MLAVPGSEKALPFLSSEPFEDGPVSFDPCMQFPPLLRLTEKGRGGGGSGGGGG